MLGARTKTRSALWRIASQQRGYFTAAQAREAGYSYQAQRYHRQRGNWTAVDRALYRFREFDVLPSGDHDHLVRWSLWGKEQAVVSYTTALSVHDLGTANPSMIHLTVPRDFRKKNSALTLHRDDLRPDEIEEREGYRVTTPVRAIIECAAARVDQETVDSAVSEALERGLTTRRRLTQAAQQLGARAELGVERALQELR